MVATLRLLKLSQKEFSTVTYAGDSESGNDEPTRKVLSIDESQPPLPVAIHGAPGRKAVAYQKSVNSKLTPTMRSFTLEGKVAVVTG